MNVHNSIYKHEESMGEYINKWVDGLIDMWVERQMIDGWVDT